MTHFIVVGKDTCPFCLKAKQLLESKSMEFSYIELKNQKDYEAFDTMMDMLRTSPGKEEMRNTIPQIFEERLLSREAFQNQNVSFILNRLMKRDSGFKHIGGYDSLNKYLT